MQNSSNRNEGIMFGGFFVRLAAYAIDCFIVWLFLMAARLMISLVFSWSVGDVIDSDMIFQYSVKDIILYILKASYFIILTYYTGTTIGKRLLNLRVIGAGGVKLSFFDVVYRETVGRFLCGISICIGYIMVGLDKEKRGIHDLLCDSRVIYEKKIRVNVQYRQSPPPPQQQPIYRQPMQQPPQQPIAPPRQQPPTMPPPQQPTMMTPLQQPPQPPTQSQSADTDRI